MQADRNHFPTIMVCSSLTMLLGTGQPRPARQLSFPQGGWVGTPPWEKAFISCSLGHGPHASSATIIMNHSNCQGSRRASLGPVHLSTLASTSPHAVRPRECLGLGGKGEAPELQAEVPSPHPADVKLSRLECWATHASQPQTQCGKEGSCTAGWLATWS